MHLSIESDRKGYYYFLNHKFSNLASVLMDARRE